jgi:FkbM family methyltransferase
MLILPLLKKILKRPFFRGQDRLFNYLFQKGQLQNGILTVKPLMGNFKIACDTSTWIGAKIVYTGDYEPSIKKVFKGQIRKGDVILDVGANIGFHTLYFAELTGINGKVIAFEPVPHNFEALVNNIRLNSNQHIESHNIALSNRNESLKIAADVNSTNPGSFNLFDQRGETTINCRIGDQLIGLKIDVVGYEAYVIEGLINTITENRPKIIFEFDHHYHQKTGLTNTFIFDILMQLGYIFYIIREKRLDLIKDYKTIESGNYLALQESQHV